MGSGISIVALADGTGPPMDAQAGLIATALAPSERAQTVANRLHSLHGGATAGSHAHIMPLPTPEIVSSLLRRDLDRVRSALTNPQTGNRQEAIREAMEALPRARRLAALLESLIPLLTAAESLRPSQTRLHKAPRQIVDSLPERSFDGKQAGGKLECYICLQDYVAGDKLRKLPCGHEFHSKCVDKWLIDVNKTCPCCRKAVCEEAEEETPTDSVPRASGGPQLRMHHYQPSLEQITSSNAPSSALSGLGPLGMPTRWDPAPGRGGVARDPLRPSVEEAALDLSHSLSTLQDLRERNSNLSRERARLAGIHRGLRSTRDQLAEELEDLRGIQPSSTFPTSPRSLVDPSRVGLPSVPTPPSWQRGAASRAGASTAAASGSSPSSLALPSSPSSRPPPAVSAAAAAVAAAAVSQAEPGTPPASASASASAMQMGRRTQQDQENEAGESEGVQESSPQASASASASSASTSAASRSAAATSSQSPGYRGRYARMRQEEEEQQQTVSNSQSGPEEGSVEDITSRAMAGLIAAQARMDARARISMDAARERAARGGGSDQDDDDDDGPSTRGPGGRSALGASSTSSSSLQSQARKKNSRVRGGVASGGSAAAGSFRRGASTGASAPRSAGARGSWTAASGRTTSSSGSLVSRGMGGSERRLLPPPAASLSGPGARDSFSLAAAAPLSSGGGDARRGLIGGSWRYARLASRA